MRARARSGRDARRSSILRFHENVSGRPGAPYTVHRLSVALSTCSATKPPLTVRSTPVRGTVSVIDETAEDEGGSVIDSRPPDASTGMTTSSASTERPLREMSTRGGVPSTSAVGRLSRSAPRTSMPAGTWMLTQPCLITSTVRRASPVTVSPLTRSS
jgi:hypothetical protein